MTWCDAATPRSSASARSAPHAHGPSGNSCSLLSGLSLQARCAPAAPGCFPCLFFPLPRPRLGSGAVLPGRSSADGGIEEFPEFRDAARSSFASRSSSPVSKAVNPPGESGDSICWESVWHGTSSEELPA